MEPVLHKLFRFTLSTFSTGTSIKCRSSCRPFSSWIWSFYSSLAQPVLGTFGPPSMVVAFPSLIVEVQLECPTTEGLYHSFIKINSVGMANQRSPVIFWLIHQTVSMPLFRDLLFLTCMSPGPDVLFGDFFRNISALSQYSTVYAIDLLGFGASDKPAGFAYTMETWADLILDFVKDIIKRPTVLVGNSVGSLACVIAASDSSRNLVRGLVLLNCAGGMNNKAIVDDWRIKLLLPLLWLVDFLLNQRRIASALFERVKKRDSLRDILSSVYGNKENVDEDLIDIIFEPANDEGALDAFVSIVTGPPGPSPVQLMPKISVPVLILWGDEDPFTPLDGPVGKYFSKLSVESPNVSLCVLKGVGHCPHDDRPELVHEKLLPWLAQLHAL
ncbi:pheophytinase, chloroplastic isoform X3 [Cucurbita maxima]|uniref:Pheophytinase, chloroplastic isoform X3 n=1 Tax=Cucurbita maxima TaxID=3661 RepID=A0A6J1I8N7_CUCMA|nr:pheophytinase, chloroplastic isoform X3 [Cucurbita maxima]